MGPVLRPAPFHEYLVAPRGDKRLHGRAADLGLPPVLVARSRASRDLAGHPAVRSDGRWLSETSYCL